MIALGRAQQPLIWPTQRECKKTVTYWKEEYIKSNVLSPLATTHIRKHSIVAITLYKGQRTIGRLPNCLLTILDDSNRLKFIRNSLAVMCWSLLKFNSNEINRYDFIEIDRSRLIWISCREMNIVRVFFNNNIYVFDCFWFVFIEKKLHQMYQWEFNEINDKYRVT